MARPRLKALLVCVVILGACGGKRRQALEALASPHASVRAAALRDLGQTGDARLAARIAPLTRDPVARVRRAATAALGAVGVGNRIGAVIARVEDADLEVRLTAVRVLADSRRPAAKRVLIETLGDPNIVVRKAAERALTALGLSKEAQQRTRAEKRLEADLVRLGATDDQVRATAVRDLGLSGRAQAVEAVAARVADPAPLVLSEVASALARLGGQKAHDALRQMSTAEAKVARVAAAAGLARIGAVADLARMANDKSPAVRQAALQAAALLSKDAAPGMAEAACAQLSAQQAPESATLLAAARVLGLAPKRCEAAIERRMTEWVREASSAPGELLLHRCRVAGALGRSEAQLQLVRALYARHRRDAVRWISGEQWSALDGPARAPAAQLPKTKKPKGPHEREGALRWLLARYKERPQGEETSDAILPPPVGREVVVAALASLAPRAQVLPLLAEVATEAPDALRVAALLRMAAIGAHAHASELDGEVAPKDAAARAIWAGVRAQAKEVRRASMKACQHFGPGLAPRALRWIQDGGFDEREAAAICLGRLRAAQAFGPLLKLLQEDAQVAVVRALAQIGDKRATQAIAALLQEDHPASRQGERVAIIEALQTLGDPSAAKPLARELSHPVWQVRLAAARALNKLSFAGARDELPVCAEDYVAAVRRVCRDAQGK